MNHPLFYFPFLLFTVQEATSLTPPPPPFSSTSLKRVFGHLAGLSRTLPNLLRCTEASKLQDTLHSLIEMSGESRRSAFFLPLPTTPPLCGRGTKRWIMAAVTLSMRVIHRFWRTPKQFANKMPQLSKLPFSRICLNVKNTLPERDLPVFVNEAATACICLNKRNRSHPHVDAPH